MWTQDKQYGHMAEWPQFTEKARMSTQVQNNMAMC